MEWNFDNQRPIYTQLAEMIRMCIITGIYQPGSRLPSVRELANEASVNPNTMQKALSELERTELIYAVRTSGRFVTEDEEKIASARRELAEGEVEDFLRKMRDLGIQKDEVIELIRRAETDKRSETAGASGKTGDTGADSRTGDVYDE